MSCRVALADAGECGNACSMCGLRFVTGDSVKITARGIWQKNRINEPYALRFSHAFCPTA